jgi:hypothetical protein
MCIVCALWNAQKLNIKEARRGLSELVNTKGVEKTHAEEVEKLLDEAEEEQKD